MTVLKVLKPREAWLDQAAAAFEAWEAMDPKPVTVNDLIAAAPRIAFELIQAVDALGQPVSDELKAWTFDQARGQSDVLPAASSAPSQSAQWESTESGVRL